jgi:hypothetical protein
MLDLDLQPPLGAMVPELVINGGAQVRAALCRMRSLFAERIQ